MSAAAELGWLRQEFRGLRAREAGLRAGRLAGSAPEVGCDRVAEVRRHTRRRLVAERRPPAIHADPRSCEETGTAAAITRRLRPFAPPPSAAAPADRGAALRSAKGGRPCGHQQR
jgi:hypothetical protein